LGNNFLTYSYYFINNSIKKSNDQYSLGNKFLYELTDSSQSFEIFYVFFKNFYLIIKIKLINLKDIKKINLYKIDEINKS